MIQLQQKTRNGYKMTIFLRADRDNINCHPPRPIPLEMAFMAITMVPKFACKTKNYIYWVRNKKRRTLRNSPITELDSFLYILSSMIEILIPILPPSLHLHPCQGLITAKHTSFLLAFVMGLVTCWVTLGQLWARRRGPPTLPFAPLHLCHCLKTGFLWAALDPSGEPRTSASSRATLATAIATWGRGASDARSCEQYLFLCHGDFAVPSTSRTYKTGNKWPRLFLKQSLNYIFIQ